MIASITFLLSWKQLPRGHQHTGIISPHKNLAKGKAAKALDLNERGLGSKVSRDDRFTDHTWNIRTVYVQQRFGDSKC